MKAYTAAGTSSDPPITDGPYRSLDQEGEGSRKGHRVPGPQFGTRHLNGFLVTPLGVGIQFGTGLAGHPA